ncbi:uncharacterized protein LOC133307739 [Gastrolobium bilobum]|uniref:uncharacterized protein LOC133307739 n=1 Tax=Gastrolobium bilobum TaxID=150636 RepID=UPI002AB0B539|nr:uncharacterized protein LOC133307739 [Gastrolobium bilobum]
MVALPVIKLGTLALKKFGKPIANCLTKEAICHPKFRQYIINFAEVSHRLKWRVQRRIYNYAADDVPIQPLDEDKVVGTTVDLLKEFFVFTVAGAIVIFETRKKEERSRLKEKRRRQENDLLRQDYELLRQELRQDKEQRRQENDLRRQDYELLRQELRQDKEQLRQELQLIQELQLKQENELQLLRQELQGTNLKQNLFEQEEGEHEKKLEIKQLATFAAFILTLMHTHGNEGQKSKVI